MELEIDHLTAGNSLSIERKQYKRSRLYLEEGKTYDSLIGNDNNFSRAVGGVEIIASQLSTRPTRSSLASEFSNLTI